MGEQSDISSKTYVSDKNLQNKTLIRFNNFDDDFSESKLGEISTFLKGKGISKEDISPDGIPCIRYGELYTKYNENIESIFSKTNLPKENLVFSEKGDILIPTSGEAAEDIATASCLNRDGIALGSDITILRTKINSLYLAYYINFKKNEIAKLAQGVSIVHLYPKDLKEYKIKYPSLEEQEKVVNFLKLIDLKINSLEKTLVLYQRYKTYFLDTLINKNNSPLEKMSNIIRITSSKNKNNENLLVLSINNKLGFISQNDQFENHKVASEDTSNYKIVEKDDFAYNPARINVGSIARLRNYNKGIVSPMYIVFKIDKDKVNLNYFENYIDSYDFRLNVLKRLEGSVRLVLSAEALKNIMIPLPNLNEQEKIGNFLEYNNKRIQLTNKKLEELKEYKKGLLQKMFC